VSTSRSSVSRSVRRSVSDVTRSRSRPGFAPIGRRFTASRSLGWAWAFTRPPGWSRFPPRLGQGPAGIAPQVPSAAATAQDRAQGVTGVMASSPPPAPAPACGNRAIAVVESVTCQERTRQDLQNARPVMPSVLISGCSQLAVPDSPAGWHGSLRHSCRNHGYPSLWPEPAQLGGSRIRAGAPRSQTALISPPQVRRSMPCPRPRAPQRAPRSP
jgi:hypothetical protein